jgi:signal transduction histidine kinase
LSERDEKILSINNELSRLIYKASHDLLGPLRTLQGLLNIAMSESNMDELQRYLKMMYSTEQKLDIALVNLLKIVTIKEVSHLSVVDWEDLISKAIRNAKKRVNGKKIQANINVPPNSEFLSDISLLEMTFEELFVNSIQFNMNPEVCIEIKGSRTETSMHLQISDNGLGIRDEERHRIFEMFYKNENSRGNGLGLYIVKTAVEKLKGKISAESRRNCGTTFTLSLPLPNPQPR